MPQDTVMTVVLICPHCDGALRIATGQDVDDAKAHVMAHLDEDAHNPHGG